MFEKHTEKARRTIFFGRYEATQFGAEFIEPEHLLLGLLREDKGLAHRTGLPTRDDVYKLLEAITPPLETADTNVDKPLSVIGIKALSIANESTEQLGKPHVDTSQLLFGIITAVATNPESPVMKILEANKLTPEMILAKLENPNSPEKVLARLAEQTGFDTTCTKLLQRAKTIAATRHMPNVNVETLLEALLPDFPVASFNLIIATFESSDPRIKTAWSHAQGLTRELSAGIAEANQELSAPQPPQAPGQRTEVTPPPGTTPA